MAEPTSCCGEPGGYCARVDTLFNMAAVHVLDVARHDGDGDFAMRVAVRSTNGEG
jgi:hypothetical protein